MNRFSELNLHIVYDNDKALIYDVPTSTAFKTTAKIGQYFSLLQREYDENHPEYVAMTNFMKKHLVGKIEAIPTHPNCFADGHLSKLTIIVSNKCNLRCKYCYAKYGEFDGYENVVMTPEQAKLYLRGLIINRFSKVDHVQFFGGEPLLGINTIEAICKEFSCLVDKGMLDNIPQYTMITNLTIMNESIKDIIIKNNITLTVSIDGPKEINDALRVYPNGTGTYDIVSKNISMCAPMVKAIESTYTRIHEQGGWSPEDLKNYISKRFDIPRETTMVIYATGKEDVCFDEFTNNSPNIKSNELDLDNVHILRALKPSYQSDLLCNAGYNTLALMPNGDLYPCHMYALNKSFLMGTYDSSKTNVYDDIEILTQSTRQMMNCVNKQNHKDCCFCWARNICHKCPAVQLISNNYGNIVDKEKCNILKEMMGSFLLHLLKDKKETLSQRIK